MLRAVVSILYVGMERDSKGARIAPGANKGNDLNGLARIRSNRQHRQNREKAGEQEQNRNTDRGCRRGAAKRDLAPLITLRDPGQTAGSGGRVRLG